MPARAARFAPRASAAATLAAGLVIAGLAVWWRRETASHLDAAFARVVPLPPALQGMMALAGAVLAALGLWVLVRRDAIGHEAIGDDGRAFIRHAASPRIGGDFPLAAINGRACRRSS